MTRCKFIAFTFVWTLMMVSSTFAADEKSEQAAVVKSFKQFAADLIGRFKAEKHAIVRSLLEIRCMSSREEMDRYLNAQLSPAEESVAPSVAEQHLIESVPIAYPPLARIAGIQGEVVLDFVVSTDGSVHSLKLESGHPLLVRESLDAVNRWRYKPFVLDGRAVETHIRIGVNFTLTDSRGGVKVSTKAVGERRGEMAVFRKERYEPETDYGIDVRKTDSLISPYVGFIEFKWHERDGECAQTKEEAEAKPFRAMGLYQTYRYTYAFQDGTWVPQGRQIHHEDPPELEDCKENNDRDFGCYVSEKPDSDVKTK